MFSILLVDDDYEDRELLKLEIKRALVNEETDLRFFEAASVNKARDFLNTRVFDLMTLDIQFDRLDEGIDALPEFFETYPFLNIIVVSGKLNKAEVTEQLFRFTKDNVLKSKRWSRHFDVLDKKDDKTLAIRRAYSFALEQKTSGDKIRELFLLAESYLEKDMIDKCLEIYQELQQMVPGEIESGENIEIFKGTLSISHAREYLDRGEEIAASLLLGHLIEKRLKAYTHKIIGRSYTVLAECGRAMERSRKLSKYKLVVFQKMIQLRNRAIHQPGTLVEEEFEKASRELNGLEAEN